MKRFRFSVKWRIVSLIINHVPIIKMWSNEGFVNSEHLLQDFWSVSDHFGTSCIKGLKVTLGWIGLLSFLLIITSCACLVRSGLNIIFHWGPLTYISQVIVEFFVTGTNVSNNRKKWRIIREGSYQFCVSD